MEGGRVRRACRETSNQSAWQEALSAQETEGHDRSPERPCFAQDWSPGVWGVVSAGWTGHYAGKGWGVEEEGTQGGQMLGRAGKPLLPTMPA